MPDFFLISGLFLSRRDRPRLAHLSRPQGRALRLFLRAVGDDPVRLQGAVLRRRARAGADVGLLYLESFIEPFGTLWFIYLLPIFFVVTKLTPRRAAAGDLAARRGARDRPMSSTGWTVIDEFARRFVYFYSGYLFATLRLRAVGSRAGKPRAGAGRTGGLWALVNGGLVASGYSEWPLVSLALGLSRRRAIIACRHAAGEERTGSISLRYCGEHSIVIYLAFFLPMAATRTLLLKTGVIPDIGIDLARRHHRRRRRRAGDLARGARRYARTSCSSAPTRSGSRRRSRRAAGGGVACRCPA